jgi:hypothetical protein
LKPALAIKCKPNLYVVCGDRNISELDERFWVEKIQSEADILTKIYSQEQGNQPCLAITQEQYEEC